MKSLILASLVFCLATPAFAEPPKVEMPATVTLTQQELTRLVQAEVGAAVASEHAREQAAAEYAKVQSAFAPKREVKP